MKSEISEPVKFKIENTAREKGIQGKSTVVNAPVGQLMIMVYCAMSQLYSNQYPITIFTACSTF